MADRTRIDWCDATINPWGWGCYGPGGTAEHPQRCSYCYAETLGKRHLRTCPDCRAFVPHWHEEELRKMTGIAGAIFCHKGRFISIWETREDALQAFEKVKKWPRSSG